MSEWKAGSWWKGCRQSFPSSNIIFMSQKAQLFLSSILYDSPLYSCKSSFNKRLFFISLYMGVHLTFDSPEASPSGPPERLTLCRSLPVSLCRIHLSICTIKSLRGRITSVYPIQFYFHNLGIIGTQEIFVVE